MYSRLRDRKILSGRGSVRLQCGWLGKCPSVKCLSVFVGKLPGHHTNLRSVGDRFNLLEKIFKQKMTEEGRASGINPPELTNNEIAVQQIIDKPAEASLHLNDNTQKNVEKQKTEEMRRRSLETFAETRAQTDYEWAKSKRSRATGAEAIEFLMKKSDERKKKDKLNFV